MPPEYAEYFEGDDLRQDAADLLSDLVDTMLDPHAATRIPLHKVIAAARDARKALRKALRKRARS